MRSPLAGAVGSRVVKAKGTAEPKSSLSNPLDLLSVEENEQAEHQPPLTDPADPALEDEEKLDTRLEESIESSSDKEEDGTHLKLAPIALAEGTSVTAKDKTILKSPSMIAVETFSDQGEGKTILNLSPVHFVEKPSVKGKEKAVLESCSNKIEDNELNSGQARSAVEPFFIESDENIYLKLSSAGTVEESSFDEKEDTDLQSLPINSVELLSVKANEIENPTVAADSVEGPSAEEEEDTKPDSSVIVGKSTPKPPLATSILLSINEITNPILDGPSSSTTKDTKDETQELRRSISPQPRLPVSALGRPYNTTPGSATPSNAQIAAARSSLRPVSRNKDRSSSQGQRANQVVAEWGNSKKRLSYTSDGEPLKKQ